MRLMQAVEIAAPGGPDALRLAERPMPQPQRGEVLIEVGAAGVNRPDILQRMGHYPPPLGASDIPGLEVSGTIIALGSGTSRFAIGDRICALLGGGGYASHAVAHEDLCLPAPPNLTMVQAAALPETLFTVWHNLFERGHLQRGDTILIHGGSSGIGTAAIQLAKAFGAMVMVTAGSGEKCAACARLGADLAINYRTQDFVEEVKTATQGRGADIILDMVGGDYVPRNFACAATGARLLQIAFQGGSRTTVDMRPLLSKRLSWAGSTLRAQNVEDKARIARAVETEVWPLIAAGRFTPMIDSTFPLAHAADAHRRMESSLHMGKIVLETAP